MSREKIKIDCRKLSRLFQKGLLERLGQIHKGRKGEVYLAGGTVRDLILGRTPADIDLTVASGAQDWAGDLARMTGGAYVLLGREEDAARVVWQGREIDFSSFREGACSINEELLKRDITINSLAVRIDPLFADPACQEADAFFVVDPAGGTSDLESRLIRVTSKYSFTSDPLRLLRIFRFATTLECSIEQKTIELAARQKEKISRVAPERVTHELDLIMASDRAHDVISQMANMGLLWEIIPELRQGVGMEQPASHHLDVFEHCLETLLQMERILQVPAKYFPKHTWVLQEYLTDNRHRVQLKWAALLHDVGKPATCGINEDKGDRITFYNHDLEGADIFTSFARRLRWSREDTAVVAKLIGGHMRPFHLANVQRQGKLSVKACLRLIKAADRELPGLFLLSMADALAGKGDGRPEQIEEEVVNLFTMVERVRTERVTPVRSGPPLLTGRDLIAELSLEPGPVFKEILEAVEEAHMEHKISSRSEALAFASQYVRENRSETVLVGQKQSHA
ncbi:MAG: HD domain-containing protein [Desulfobulbaceae bacterium]|nr:HD domain-containing protein [Desulfobulbaceae bacterium]